MKKYLSAIIILLIFNGCSLNKTSNEARAALPEGTFAKFNSQYGEYYAGTVFVKGYSEIKRVKESFCDITNMNESGTEPCNESEYVLFHIVKNGKTPNFDEYLPKEWPADGNQFFGEKAIGLGCIHDGNIVYSNDTDSYEIVNGTLGTDLSKKILGSDIDSPIALKLTKKTYTRGRGAPACYSHITIIEEF